MLAIWKAGGAYVALDPKVPVDRLHYMVKDAKVCVVITNQELQDKVNKKYYTNHTALH